MSDEEITQMKRLVETDFYQLMKNKWLSFIKIGLICQIAGFIVGLVLEVLERNYRIEIPFPTIEGIPTLDLSSITVSLFSATITTCGIIIGFFSVCVFFAFEWSERKTRDFEEKVEQENSLKRLYQLRIKVIWAWRDAFSRYSELFIKTSILLLFVQMVSFLYCHFSGIFVGLNIVIELNSLLITATGLYPIIKNIFWYKEPESRVRNLHQVIQ